jgi:hypothetical protein
MSLGFEPGTGALPDETAHRCHILEANGEKGRLRQARKKPTGKPYLKLDSNQA